MGFIARLGILYIVLITFAALAFRKRKRVLGVSLSLIMAAGILVLGYLWITSPM